MNIRFCERPVSLKLPFAPETFDWYNSVYKDDYGHAFAALAIRLDVNQTLLFLYRKRL
jgi:hypothetical protein